MKYFILSSLSVVGFSNSAHAGLNVYTHSLTLEDHPSGNFVDVKMTKHNNDELLRVAAVHASAAYNDIKSITPRTQYPLRFQDGCPDREALINEGYEIIAFNAKIPGRGEVPAGIITYKKDAGGEIFITVAFHGSECLEDFTEANLWAFKKKDPSLGVTGYVHGGFYDRYMKSRLALLDVFEGIFAAHPEARENIGNIKVLFTGHSLGASLASLALPDILTHFPALAPHASLVTFSSPRVFDHESAVQIRRLVPEDSILRIWRENDPVCRLPFGVLDFEHIGKSIKLPPHAPVGLKNHNLKTLKADALSDEDIKFDSNHVGYRTWVKDTISQGVQVMTQVVKQGLQVVSGWMQYMIGG